MKTGISVIICCYNSEKRIKPTLEHLFKQKGIPIDKWEVIIVDNASADNTSQQAMQIWHDFELPRPMFRVIKESKAGLSNARNKGIDEAVFDYVLFCDDDNWLDESYLSISLGLMQSSENIGALGGIGSPVFEDKEPPYFWINQYHTLAVGPQWSNDGDITHSRSVLYGAGMVVNKLAYIKLIEDFKFEFKVTGRIGNNLISSEDHELCLALKTIGYRIYYSEKLKFQHFIPQNRTSINYYKKLFTGFGMSIPMLSGYYLNDTNIMDIKYDYRYIILRSLKNIIKLRTKLILSGFYFASVERYKYIGDLQELYTNLGTLKMLLTVKNKYKNEWKGCFLFQYKYNELQN